MGILAVGDTNIVKGSTTLCWKKKIFVCVVHTNSLVVYENYIAVFENIQWNPLY